MDPSDLSLDDEIAGVSDKLDIPMVALGLKESAPVDLKAAFAAFLEEFYFESPDFFSDALTQIQVCGGFFYIKQNFLVFYGYFGFLFIYLHFFCCLLIPHSSPL